MAMTYASLVSDLQVLMVDAAPSADFTSILPSMIAYAEQRIYTKLNFLYTRTSDATTTFTNGNRQITLPTNIIIVEGMAAISPAATSPSAGTRNPLERVSLDFIDQTWPVEATKALPLYFSLLSDTVAVVAPTPDAAYKCEVTGIFRPTPLSASNTTSYITANYPLLMEAACMVYGTGFQQNFGAQSDNPQMAQSWETQYNILEAEADAEEMRRKANDKGGAPYPPSPADEG